MGSPLWEPDRIPVNEKPHRRVIPRSYAIMTRPVTMAEWQEFRKDRPDVAGDYLERYSAGPAGPMIQVNWFMAAQYCNWLSKKEGIPAKEWCYQESARGVIKPYSDYLRRTGYRLPSEAEWEYACRAGAVSSRYYGALISLLSRYAHFLANSQDRTWSVGQKRPNDLGLFDMHGNVWTWCQESPFRYPPGRVEDNEIIRDINSRVLRGASFFVQAPDVRSANRNIDAPANRDVNIGVRVARTYH
jgi:formylglycine-generating enzyme required for sulfatase activity